MMKKCRRCEQILERAVFRNGRQICISCMNKAQVKYLEAEKLKRSSDIKMYADDIVRQFYRGSSMSLMCACRYLVKHYEKCGIHINLDWESEGQ